MQIATFFDPAALAIVGVGTALSAVLRNPAADLARAIAALPCLLRRPFSAEPLLEQLAAQGRIARRHGAHALDRSIITDRDLAAGIDAVVDGEAADAVQALLEQLRRARAERHAAAIDVWRGMADAAPAMGMVGTLVGLAAMFATMTDPQAIGGAMAVALLATLYGALLANLVFTPIAHRLAARSRHEHGERGRLIAPLAALAAREAPRMKHAA